MSKKGRRRRRRRRRGRTNEGRKKKLSLYPPPLSTLVPTITEPNRYNASAIIYIRDIYAA